MAAERIHKRSRVGCSALNIIDERPAENYWQSEEKLLSRWQSSRGTQPHEPSSPKSKTVWCECVAVHGIVHREKTPQNVVSLGKNWCGSAALVSYAICHMIEWFALKKFAVNRELVRVLGNVNGVHGLISVNRYWIQWWKCAREGKQNWQHRAVECGDNQTINVCGCCGGVVGSQLLHPIRYGLVCNVSYAYIHFQVCTRHGWLDWFNAFNQHLRLDNGPIAESTVCWRWNFLPAANSIC